jgi:hypothetical protein
LIALAVFFETSRFLAMATLSVLASVFLDLGLEIKLEPSKLVLFT